MKEYPNRLGRLMADEALPRQSWRSASFETKVRHVAYGVDCVDDEDLLRPYIFVSALGGQL